VIHNRIKAAVAAVTIAGATAAAMLVPSSPAVAFSSGGLVLDIVVQSPAHLIANGAAIAVPIEYTCFGTIFPPTLQVDVTEAVGNGIASGGIATTNANCTGEIQSTTLDVTATPGGRAFAKGTAFATANIFGCGSSTCGQQASSLTIAIRR
jgi:hypothetical protein